MKLLARLLILFLSLNAISQDIDLIKSILSNSDWDKFFLDKLKSVSFDSVRFNEPTLLLTLENDSNLIRTQEVLSFQNIDIQTNNKDFSDDILYHCGPLTDGLYLNRNASDVVTSRLMDDFINNYLIKSWLFPKK